MAFAQGSRSQITYIPEVTFGTTPGTPTMIEIPLETHSIELSKERLQINDLQSDRMTRVDRHGNRSAAGDITCTLRAGDYDAFLESAFFSTFATNTLKIGTTLKSFTLEDGALDIGQYRAFTGMAVSQMTMNISPNNPVRTTFSFVGSNATQSGTSLDATPTAASTNQPFDSYTGSITVSGGAVNVVSSMDITINNSLSPTFVIGSDSTPQLEYGRAQVEGTITVYYEDDTFLNRFLNETTAPIVIALSDVGSANTYTFTFPACKFNSGSVPVADEQSRLITMSFVAIYDSGSSTNVQLVRS